MPAGEIGDLTVPINELGKPGVPDLKNDIIIGLPGPVYEKRSEVVRRGQVITQPSHINLVPPGKRKVTVLRDTELVYPDLWFSVYVEGDAHDEKMFAQMFVRAQCRRAKTPDEADLVVFTGGADVDPSFYGAKEHWTTGPCDIERDRREMALFLECKEKGIPMFGVCRGAQLIHVAMGGELYQDVDEHNRPHAMISTADGLVLPHVSSVHHQMIHADPKLGISIIGVSSNANNRKLYQGDGFVNHEGRRADVEAYFYRDVCALGVQGHPEYSGYYQYTQWVLEQIDSLINCNPDCDWDKSSGKYRLKEEFRKERDAREVKSIITSAVEKAKQPKNKKGNK